MTAIFGVPQPICAESYLSGVQRFDELRGRSTCLRHIHFVDVSDEMVTMIQRTFTAKWNIAAVPGTQQAQPSATTGISRQESSTQPPQKSTEEKISKPVEPAPSTQSSTSHENKVQEPVRPPRSSQSDDKPHEPIGLPYLKVTGEKKELQAQVHFRGLNLVLIFQSQTFADIQTEAIVLWQDPENIMKDPISKQFTKKLNSQAPNTVSKFKKQKVLEGTVHCVRTMNRFLVFPVLSTSSSHGEDKIGSLVEQALNKVELEQKSSVAITRTQKRAKGKLT